MIEETVVAYMSKRLPVAVFMEVPEKPPAQFVVLRKISSSRENWIDTATFTADSYAESMLAAARLNELVKSAMDNLPELSAIGSAKLALDYSFPDMASKRYRYQAMYDITHY